MVEVKPVKLGIKRPAVRGLLPDPEPREVNYTLISCDDHLLEPPHAFEGRLPAKYQDMAPKVVETAEGHEVWSIDGTPYFQVGFMAVAGRPKEDQRIEPSRFSEVRRGCWDIHARIQDMDLGGIWGSVNFPSGVTGFGGTLFSEFKDQEFGLACVRAWNDWLYEEWHGSYPDRIAALGITHLTDPVIGAEEVRRNAKRGFKAMTLPERPHTRNLPPVYSDHWDPLIRACAETGTCINLHVGSAGFTPQPEGAPMLEVGATMFQAQAFTSCAEWLWAGWASRYPDLKIVMSEGGIGWVAGLIDRLDNIMSRSGYGGGWQDKEMGPSDRLRNNFWFTMIDDPSSVPAILPTIGVEHVMAESDYPHGDGTWPDTQEVLKGLIGHLSPQDQRKICCENASQVYGLPVPADAVPKR